VGFLVTRTTEKPPLAVRMRNSPDASFTQL
jgi:hypothetical protein